jgi:glycyl-tRNA synthetase beta chain
VTVAVSLADKLDNILSFFRQGIRPTGSSDPFALRRQTIALINQLSENSIRLPLAKVFFEHIDIGSQDDWYADIDNVGDVLSKLNLLAPSVVDEGLIERSLDAAEEASGPSREEIIENDLKALDQVLDFFADRLKVQQREAGVRHDLIDAVFALGGEDDLVRLLARVHALQAFVTTEDGTNLLAGYKRAANILKKEGFDAAPSDDALSYTPDPAEKALIDALALAAPQAAAAVEAEQFADAMAALATLRAPIDRFFEEVTVNDADANKRAARLALLAGFRDAVHRVADFSRIEG